MTTPREVVLWRGRDDRGSRLLTATLHENGDVGIGGQDLGAGVAEAFGPQLHEYEWDWRIAAIDVPRAVSLLGGEQGDDPIATLRRWSAVHPFQDPGQFLKEAGLEPDFWSRIGD